MGFDMEGNIAGQKQRDQHDHLKAIQTKTNVSSGLPWIGNRPVQFGIAVREKAGHHRRQVTKQHFMDVPVAWRECRMQHQFAMENRKPDKDGEPRIDRPQQEERPEAVRQDGKSLIGAAPRRRRCCRAHVAASSPFKTTSDKGPALFLFPVGIELLEKGDQIVGFLLVLQAGIDHLGARDLRFRVLDVFAEGRLIPGDPGILVGGRI